VRIFKRRPAPAAVPDPQCTATTRAGARCRLPAVPGTSTCLLHKPKLPTTPAAALRRSSTCSPLPTASGFSSAWPSGRSYGASPRPRPSRPTRTATARTTTPSCTRMLHAVIYSHLTILGA